MSKLDDEIKSFTTPLKNLGRDMLNEFDNPTATAVKMFIERAAQSQSLMWFMLGIGIEALGLSIQAMLGMDSYAILDFLVAAIIVTALYVYQNKRRMNVKRTTVEDTHLLE